MEAKVNVYVSKSVALRTLEGYEREWKRWTNSAVERGYPIVPSKIPDLEDYLVSEVDKSVAVLAAVSASVRWHCVEADFGTPFES